MPHGAGSLPALRGMKMQSALEWALKHWGLPRAWV
jgi:hypothetical protein